MARWPDGPIARRPDGPTARRPDGPMGDSVVMKLSQDLKFAVRVALRNPAFTGIVILTLGLGIGANAAIFNLLDQVLLRRLPVQSPEQLVFLDGPGAFQGFTHNEHTFSYPMFTDFRDRNEVFSGVLARM